MIPVAQGCAIYACIASKLLGQNKILRVQLEFGFHLVCVFVWNNRLRVYDPCGTWTLPKKLNLDSTPKSIAKAWHQLERHPEKLISAEWHK